jgi:hypothetical protein
MMISMIFWMSCTEPIIPEENYQTAKNATDTSDSGSPDTGTNIEDTSEPTEDSLHKIYFNTTNISCEELEHFSVALTQVIPGGLEQDADDDNDVRNDLLTIVDLEYLRVEASSFLDVEKDELNPSNGCIFTITLPEDVPGNLKDVIAVGEDPESLADDSAKWAFYALTLITNEKISCEDPGAKIIDCSLAAQPPLSSIDYTKSNPELEDGDVHIWLSDIYLNYATGVLSPSLQDMGFSNGWNLADISDGVMTVIESFSEESDPDDLELMPISVTLSDLVPTYSISLSVENDWSNVVCDEEGDCSKNQLGLRPASWIIEGVDSSSTSYAYRNLYYNGLGTSTMTSNLEFQVWGIPASNYFFFGEAIAIESEEYSFFQQWGDFVDVAVHAPVMYEGIYNIETETEAWATPDMTPKGAMCRGTERIVLVYYAAADNLEEAIWYRLTGLTPGWWRFRVPATIGSTDYSNLQLSPGCSVPDWN